MNVFLITETIIPLTLVGYEMIIANEAHSAHDPTRARGIIAVKYTTVTRNVFKKGEREYKVWIAKCIHG